MKHAMLKCSIQDGESTLAYYQRMLRECEARGDALFADCGALKAQIAEAKELLRQGDSHSAMLVLRAADSGNSSQ